MKKERVCLVIEDEILKEMDKIRGPISRSTFIGDVLKQALKNGGVLTTTRTAVPA